MVANIQQSRTAKAGGDHHVLPAWPGDISLPRPANQLKLFFWGGGQRIGRWATATERRLFSSAGQRGSGTLKCHPELRPSASGCAGAGRFFLFTAPAKPIGRPL